MKKLDWESVGTKTTLVGIIGVMVSGVVYCAGLAISALISLIDN